jgi:hypothetical protein
MAFRAGNNTNLSFDVILNPCSGPCPGSLPEPAYIEEIPKLRDYPNIRTLGYVATNYTDKALDSVLAEIRQWASWPILMNDTRMAVDSIFFDEIPGLYQWQKHDYLKTAADSVQASELLGHKLVGESILWCADEIIDGINQLQYIIREPCPILYGTTSILRTRPSFSKTRLPTSLTRPSSTH